jgi:glycosyltransferase involved in cell wall biosynthesis
MNTNLNKSIQEALVSVIIPAFNRKDDLDACLSSLLKQNFTDFDVLVIDDGSSDDTAGYIKKKYPWVQLIINKANMGVNYCRNMGIANSAGQYLLFLDSDMVLNQPDQIALMVRIMSHDPGIGALGGVYQKSDPGIWGCYFDGSRAYADQDGTLKECDYVPSGNLFMKRKELEHCRGFDEFIKGDGTESEMGMNLKRKGLRNLIGRQIAAEHHESSLERNNIGLGLDKRYSQREKEEWRELYQYRNRLRYFFKNGSTIDGAKFFLRLTFNNVVSLLAFVKQQFLGMKNAESERFHHTGQRIGRLLFKIRVIFDPFTWNMARLFETLKSRRIDFLTNKTQEV